jgi:hypothetical protein
MTSMLWKGTERCSKETPPASLRWTIPSCQQDTQVLPAWDERENRHSVCGWAETSPSVWAWQSPAWSTLVSHPHSTSFHLIATTTQPSSLTNSHSRIGRRVRFPKHLQDYIRCTGGGIMWWTNQHLHCMIINISHYHNNIIRHGCIT